MLKQNATHSSVRIQVLSVSLVVFAVIWIVTGLYIPQPIARTIASLPAVLFITRGIRRWLHDRHLLYCREQYKWLLEHLLSRLSAGSTIERAFLDAPDSLAGLFRSKAGLADTLRRIAAQLKAKRPLDNLVSDLGDKIALPEAKAFFNILPVLCRSGSDINQFIRQNLHLTSSQLILHKDLEAEGSQRRTEAIILSIMPFLMALFLNQSEQLLDQRQANPGFLIYGMLFAWVLAMLAVILVINTQAAASVRSHRNEAFIKTRCRTDHLRAPGRIVQLVYRRFIPEYFSTRLLRTIQEEARKSDEDPNRLIAAYFNSKTLILFAGFLSAAVIIRFRPDWAVPACLLPIVFAFCQDREVLMLKKRRELEDQLIYPIFLHIAATLLMTGLSLHRSMELTMANLPDLLQSTALRRDLNEFHRKTRVGIPAGHALNELADVCSIPQIQTALAMMARYECDGGPENLQILQLQIDACWALHRQAIRKKSDQMALRLLIPMGMDLAAVLMTALLPAIQMLQRI